MRAGGMKKRRARAFRLESLEDRSLLNAAMPSFLAAEIHTLKKTLVTQILQGQVNGQFALKGQTVTLLNVTGNLSVIGNVTVTGKFKLVENLKTHVGKVSGGLATFKNAAGDKVNVTFTGSGTGTTQFTFTTKGSILSRVGKFKGYTGPFSSNGSADNTTGTFKMDVTITARKLM